MRRVFRHLVLLALLLWGTAGLRADTFTLTDGTSITGEILSADDRGVMFRLTGDQTSDRISWIKFTQETLRVFQKNTKTARYIEPYLEIDQSKKAQKREVKIVSWEKPSREEASSFLGGFLGSGLGLFIAFLIYLANLYAAYEISVVRAYPWYLVIGLAAVVPILTPAVFICLPTRIKTRQEEEEEILSQRAAEEAAAAAAAAGEGGELPPEMAAEVAAAEAAPEPLFQPLQKFTRGQFTFNRRFFETKFPSWFTVVRRDTDKELVLVFKTHRGKYTANRISRLGANDLALQVPQGGTTQEVVVNFQEIQEVTLKHRDDPSE